MAFEPCPFSNGGIFDFGSSLTAFADAVDVTVVDVARIIALAIYNGVVAKTPVDTGAARANWQVPRRAFPLPASRRTT